MAWIFGDSFDLYAAPVDATAGYWDSGTVGFVLSTNGRFTGGRAILIGTNAVYLTKASGTNDPVHHIVYAFEQTTALSGTTKGSYFNLADGATAQCSIVHQSDGSILLTSAAAGGGTVLATYPAAVASASTWNSFEIEVVIHPTAGSFKVRANGSPTDSFSAINLNTRNGTANSYANSLSIGCVSNAFTQLLDDFLWRSDATSGAGLATWVGDIRCYARMPASNGSVQFATAPNPVFYPASANTATTQTRAANLVYYFPVIPTRTGVVTSISINLNTAITGNMICGLYDATGAGAGPGALLATSAQVVNPVLGMNTFTIASGPTLVAGTTYWVAVLNNVSAILTGSGVGAFVTYTQTYTYSTTLPTTAASLAQTTTGSAPNSGVNLTLANFSAVNEAQQDAAATYVFDSTVGDADFYNIAPIAVTPVATIAVTTRGFAQKSDAGTRNGAMQLKSGSSTVASPSTALTTSWGWLWRTDANDPATGTAWTATGVNNAQVGPSVTA